MISQMNWFWAWVCSLLLTKTCKSLCWCPLQLQCLNLYSPEQYVQTMCVIAYFWQKLSVHGSLNIFLLPYINNNSKNIFVWVMFTYIIKNAYVWAIRGSLCPTSCIFVKVQLVSLSRGQKAKAWWRHCKQKLRNLGYIKYQCSKYFPEINIWWEVTWKLCWLPRDILYLEDFLEGYLLFHQDAFLVDARSNLKHNIN